jgi:hypothetical protein
MMKGKRLIYGVLLTNRMVEAPTVQALFSEYGCHIKTRLGLHNVDDSFCSGKGLVLLEMFGDETKCRELGEKLATIEGVEVQSMEFGC